jgi:hypothetical protein
MYFSIDIIEETVALCVDDNGETCAIPLDMIDGEISEGSVLLIGENERYYVDEAETEKRRESNFALAESLFDE